MTGLIRPAGAAAPIASTRRSAPRRSPSRAPSHLHVIRPLLAALVTLILISAGNAAAQYPAELTGRVVDAVTGEPVEAVTVEVLGTGLSVLSDGRGEFRIRGLEPGRHRVRLGRLGYATEVRDVEMRNGAVTHLLVRLGARPIELQEVHGEVAGGAGPATPGAIIVPREEIEGSGAATAGELLDGRAGLVVRRHGATGPQTLSVRGGSADEVLVLLDGAPLSNPLTGEADLSTVPTSQIESITVLKGSGSARFGPGAAAGVVLIETRGAAPSLAARAERGSLGTWSVGAETGGEASALSWSAGGHLRSLDGEFEFRRPRELGGDLATRRNADLWEAGAFASATGPLAGGRLQLRGGYSRRERGLPGPVYQPTPDARQESNRWNGQGAWERRWRRARLAARFHALTQRTRFADPEPPTGLPYRNQVNGTALGGRLTGELQPGGTLESLSAGVEVRRQSFESDLLDAGAPDGRTDLGLFAAGELAPFRSGAAPRLQLALRLDRDGLDELWRATHEITVTGRAGPAAFHIRHASSLSPPSFGDQFFREGVMVKPNPGLRAERIPSELNLGVQVHGPLAGFALGRFALDGYVADVKDMILWAPDHRFVWSPRNFDVKRRGLDASGELQIPRASLALRAAYGLARATYDRPGDDSVQVMYRPRHSGSLGVSWQPANWEFGLDARYTGVRYPVPAQVNALRPFWSLDLQVRRSFRAGAWRITPALHVDRAFDNTDALIFGYPDPGRRIRLEVRAKPYR